MVNNQILNENVIEPILTESMQDIASLNLIDELQYKVISSNDLKDSKEIKEISLAIISGDSVLLVEGYDKVLIISSKGWPTRSISEPKSEKIVRGPHEGFTEAIMVNLSMVRRKIKSHELKFQFKEVGVRSLTKTCICYIEDIASKEIVEEVVTRLSKIEIDAILDSGYIQELVRDAPLSPFETIGNTERPDVVAARLLEGRIALFVDGSPIVLTMPYLFVENFQASEDYYNNILLCFISLPIKQLAESKLANFYKELRSLSLSFLWYVLL